MTYLCSEKTNDMKESKTKDTKKKGTNKKDTKNLFTRIKLLDELLSDQYHNYSMDDIVDKMNDRLEDMGCESVSRRCVQTLLLLSHSIIRDFKPLCDVSTCYFRP